MVNISDPSLLRGFSVFIRARLGLPHSPPMPSEPVVCLVRRSGNRRILNEEEVVSVLSKFVSVKVVQLDTLSYHEQVNSSPSYPSPPPPSYPSPPPSPHPPITLPPPLPTTLPLTPTYSFIPSLQVAQMQKFTILVGFHGAELLNALYMPPDSVTVQLVPFGAKSLPVGSYAQVLRANGPYLEWQNMNERLSRPNEVGDRDNNQADTILNTDDISDLVKSAMKMGINAKFRP